MAMDQGNYNPGAAVDTVWDASVESEIIYFPGAAVDTAGTGGGVSTYVPGAKVDTADGASGGTNNYEAGQPVESSYL